jgi:hypothetical protein
MLESMNMTNIQWYPLYKLARDELALHQIYYASYISICPTDRPWIFHISCADYYMALRNVMHLWLEEHKIQYQLDYQIGEGLLIGMNDHDMCLFVLCWKS